MASSMRIFGLSPGQLLAVGTGLTALTMAAILFTNSENLMRSSFGSALVASGEALAPVRTAKPVPLSGSEDFWLSAMRQDGGAPLTKTVGIGDHMTMTLGGVERQLDVAAVSEFEPKITTIDTNSAATRFVLVTARDSRNAAARPIRFVMEIESAETPLAGVKTARAL